VLARRAHLGAAALGRYASVLIFGAWLSASASAEVREPAAERGSVMLAAFNTGRNTDARFDSGAPSSNGTDIDLEDDLGLEHYMTVARLSGYVWITQRQRIDFSLFDLSREASKTLQKSIVLGDETFAINADVDTVNELKIYKIDYTFAALNRDRGFLGIVAGLYVARTGVRVSEAARGTAESEQLTAPLPVIGLRGEYAFGERFTLRGAAELFALKTGGIDGRLHDSYVGVDYSFGKRFAFGVAYNDVSMNVSAEEAGFHGRLDAGYRGALLYFKVDFGAIR
jgi:hypothetical protein